ncbi:VC0807 family protein [Amycolatopsis sp. CA-126428]|uniref:VC0807 family protein n=1 Tax=Amycolatopsis sp. CA-126428 TaxID=2073158 RepID=UPI001E5F4D3B|nr:VC0807 family protein [Amycolatopsis sp. CA-126428]
MKRLNGALIEVLAPLALFYGLRAAGVNQLLALLAGAAIPVVTGLRDLVAGKRIGGVRWFVLGAMAVTVAGSFISGSPRALLLRGVVLMAALGGFLLVTVWARRPFLYEAARTVFDEDKQRTWRRNWDDHPPFRRLLRLCSALWAAACLLDAALRAVIVLVLPVDTVPLAELALLVVTLAAIVIVQRVFGRAFLRRHGLRLDGVEVTPVAVAG